MVLSLEISGRSKLLRVDHAINLTLAVLAPRLRGGSDVRLVRALDEDEHDIRIGRHPGLPESHARTAIGSALLEGFHRLVLAAGLQAEFDHELHSSPTWRQGRRPARRRWRRSRTS